MRKSRYSEDQINNAIKASEAGIKAKEICQQLGISEATFYSWKKKFSHMASEEIRKIKILEEKLHLLNREMQNLISDKEMLQSVLKNFLTTSEKRQSVNYLQHTYDIGIRHSCRLINISRSVYHYSSHEDKR